MGHAFSGSFSLSIGYRNWTEPWNPRQATARIVRELFELLQISILVRTSWFLVEHQDLHIWTWSYVENGGRRKCSVSSFDQDLMPRSIQYQCLLFLFFRCRKPQTFSFICRWVSQTRVQWDLIFSKRWTEAALRAWRKEEARNQSNRMWS